MYDINLNYLGVRSQKSGGKKEEERGIEGDSFWGSVKVTEFYSALIQTIIPQITNAKKSNQ
ncbi:MAG: hypothetical protein F6K34_16470 [Okeania sp. SIO4D6]|nr:hypothetical protein [Okeania sp. SIO4D6]